MLSGVVAVMLQRAGDPSRFAFVRSHTSTVVGVPFDARTSAAEWTPSPFVSRYMYCARTPEADARRPTIERMRTRDIRMAVASLAGTGTGLRLSGRGDSRPRSNPTQAS